jgi:hypothetical protein
MAQLVDRDAKGNPIAKRQYTVRGNEREVTFGQSLADVGDTNADGWPDFAIGAPERRSLRRAENDDAPGVRGRVLLVCGKTGEVIREITMSDKTGHWHHRAEQRFCGRATRSC